MSIFFKSSESIASVFVSNVVIKFFPAKNLFSKSYASSNFCIDLLYFSSESKKILNGFFSQPPQP
ncbi:hypothetical protein OVS_01805 [Mycoplasma ovis str. Michigan]|uniref:Uncharacterized protein n=1 Tax=Mycoplasma ovis str. Michigan TaxID=1415773 RepID=A0ABN4BMN6_9MOLU|nr:hypothetical protein OVS_01805 [Mycoplasma ovis str. Michigan]